MWRDALMVSRWNTGAGGQDLFVVKYNSSGVKWTKNSNFSNVRERHHQWLFGNVYVTDALMVVSMVNNAGVWDLFVVKYNSSEVNSGQSNSELLLMMMGEASPVTLQEMSMWLDTLGGSGWKHQCWVLISSSSTTAVGSSSGQSNSELLLMISRMASPVTLQEMSMWRDAPMVVSMETPVLGIDSSGQVQQQWAMDKATRNFCWWYRVWHHQWLFRKCLWRDALMVVSWKQQCWGLGSLVVKYNSNEIKMDNSELLLMMMGEDPCDISKYLCDWIHLGGGWAASAGTLISSCPLQQHWDQAVKATRNFCWWYRVWHHQWLFRKCLCDGTYNGSLDGT